MIFISHYPIHVFLFFLRCLFYKNVHIFCGILSLMENDNYSHCYCGHIATISLVKVIIIRYSTRIKDVSVSYHIYVKLCQKYSLHTFKMTSTFAINKCLYCVAVYTRRELNPELELEPSRRMFTLCQSAET